MLRAFKYRLWTNANQERELGIMLETHRRLYNSCLAERKTAYDVERRTIGYFEQAKKFTRDRKTNDFYARLNAQTAQATMRRLDKAFQAYFRRVKQGGKAGYPRFKNKDRFNSITYPQFGRGFRLVENRLRVHLLGTLRVKLHRPIEGRIKTMTLHRDGDKWYAVFSCDLDEPVVQPSTNPPVGIDVGLHAFLTTSDGEYEVNPRHFKEALPHLRREQRSVSRKSRGGSNHRKARKKVAKVHAKVANLRRDHHHKTALSLVRRYGLIAVESLNIQGMLKNHRLARAISDAGWSGFLTILRSKAESAGVVFVEVDARMTTQECSACGEVVPKTLSQRRHVCRCGLNLDRDENAARNILARGLQAWAGPAEVNVGHQAKRPPRSRRLTAAE